MSISGENRVIRDTIVGFEKRIDEMHLGFQRYRSGDDPKMPRWEDLEQEILVFSRKKIMDFALNKQLERVMYKFQTRKKIWLRWVEEYQRQGEGADSPSTPF